MDDEAKAQLVAMVHACVSVLAPNVAFVFVAVEPERAGPPEALAIGSNVAPEVAAMLCEAGRWRSMAAGAPDAPIAPLGKPRDQN